MTYQAGIPLPGDKPSVSRGDIFNNFTQLNTQFVAEHNAFNSASHDGKHKYVTLQRSAGVPPVGTNMILAQALTPAGNPYLQSMNSTTIFSIPLVYTQSVVIPAAGTTNLFDFAALGFVPQAGTLLVYDVNTTNKTILSPFVYVGGVLETPGTTGQLRSGSDLVRFDSAGSVLQLETAIATTVSVRVIGTAV